MSTNIRAVKDLKTLLEYFAEKLSWPVDLESFESIEDITYGFEAEDIGLKEEEFSKISSLYQIRPLSDNQPWGIFAVEFDSARFQITALRKVLSGLVPKRRNSGHAMWNKHDLLFLCFWGPEDSRTIGLAHFDDNVNTLPKLRMIHCNTSIEVFEQIAHFESKLSVLSWPDHREAISGWREKWTAAFSTRYHQTITESQTLVKELAKLAKDTKSRILEIFKVENANGYVNLLYMKFKDMLIHDLTEEQFADMYAQTVAYGLFSAKCMDTSEHFLWEEAVDRIPNTNPFLKSLIKECFNADSNKLSFDELELDEIVNLLDHTNTDRILEDFNRQTGDGKEDPVIYFYEGFLTEYESEQKKRRGVYYTPLPVVTFIVRAVDDILKSEFGFEDGLADTSTRTVTIKRDSKKKIDNAIRQVEEKIDVPYIQILDPATGTGTFLREVIVRIWESFCKQHKSYSKAEINRLWNIYVLKHLLPRLNGFELMMAPYAVAHMKLAMVLKDTGYNFSGEERLDVLLTNSLEEPGDSSLQMNLFSDPLAMEAIDANRVKRNQGINIVVGNPPYSGESANKNDWIAKLMEDYKKEPGGLIKLQERNPKWLNDDYVKFIRFAQYFIERSGSGVLAYINPHGFLNNPTFRGMRWRLLKDFDKIYIIDLHGNSNKQECCPDGSKDENVFDIQQGVSINIFIKIDKKRKDDFAVVFHCDIYGLRDTKYNYLIDMSIDKIDFHVVKPAYPEYYFQPQDYDLKRCYDKGLSINELFGISSVGVVTANDSVLINYDKSSLVDSVSKYYEIEAKQTYVEKINYRPFDTRFVYYDTSKIERSRIKVMRHLLGNNNIGLITARSNKSETCDHFFCSKYIIETKCGERSTQSAIFPLYRYDESFDDSKKTPNLNQNMVQKIASNLHLEFSEDHDESELKYFSPLNLFDYIYAVLYSPSYRKIYSNFLKNDFPRVPYPDNNNVFWTLVAYGRKLRMLHLLEFDLTEKVEITLMPIGENEIEKITYLDESVYINNTQHFPNVPKVVWEFCVGGYLPAQRWLKERKGRRLTNEDILHYRKIIVALAETDRLMKEIDEVMIVDS